MKNCMLLATVIMMTVNAHIASAQHTNTSHVFDIPQSGIKFLTGDTWEQGSQQLRLYGVQSCLRKTFYTDAVGNRQDCGAVSLAMFAAIVRDTKPTCSTVAQIPATAAAPVPTILVVCSAHVGGKSLDLGTVLITQGFGFAAFSNSMKPVYMPYVVAEAAAKSTKIGLWAYPDLPHPNSVLFKVAHKKVQ